jgi:hypothetical protein
MFPQMDCLSIGSRQITGLSSCRAATYILLVHDHRDLTCAAHGRSLGGATLWGIRYRSVCGVVNWFEKHLKTRHVSGLFLD